ncbi:MAG: metal-sensitive transcriptional regulator [Anaerolineaceae bacterium]|nr:metal-sensitive transcriptional regulator [Anaerolineaceae bacterium]
MAPAGVLAGFPELVKTPLNRAFKESELKMKNDVVNDNDQLKRRLAKIEGQVRGIQKMLEEGRDCQAIMQQLIAVRSGVQSASLAYVNQLATECIFNIAEDNDPISQQDKLKEIIDLLGKASA